MFRALIVALLLCLVGLPGIVITFLECFSVVRNVCAVRSDDDDGGGGELMFYVPFNKKHPDASLSVLVC